MAQKHQPGRTRPPERAEEERARLEAEQARGAGPKTKPESEMSHGKNYPSELPENRQKFDPATTRTPQEGQGQGG